MIYSHRLVPPLVPLKNIRIPPQGRLDVLRANAITPTPLAVAAPAGE